MNRKQLQTFGERYGVLIAVDQLTDENMAKVGEDIRQLLKKWQWIANFKKEKLDLNRVTD